MQVKGHYLENMSPAMNTGHDGSLTTLHANSPAEVVPRLVMMVRYGMDLPTEIIEAQVVSALDLVVQQDRLSGGKRRITQIAMRGAPGTAASSGSGRFFTPVVTWDRRSQRYIWSDPPEWVYDLSYMNIASDEEVSSWVQSVQRC